MRRRAFFKGFLIGALVGIVGVALLALFSDSSPLLDTLGFVLFYPAGYVIGTLLDVKEETGIFILLIFAFNAFLYGLIGMLLQAVVRKLRR